MRPVSYDTHDNGGRAFRVKIADNQDGTKHIVVRQLITRRSRPLFQLDSPVVFVGKSRLNNMTQFSGGHGRQFDGNSILVQMEDSNTYLHIGRGLIVFRTKFPISRYESPVGNNDVPYPYAVDNDGNYYLIIEYVVLLSHPGLAQDAEADGQDPYTYYYDQHLMSMNLGRRPPAVPADGLYHDIKYITIGTDQYTLNYVPRAASNYDRLMSWDKGRILLHYQDGTVEELNKNGYIELMETFGREHDFEELNVVSERNLEDLTTS